MLLHQSVDAGVEECFLPFAGDGRIGGVEALPPDRLRPFTVSNVIRTVGILVLDTVHHAPTGL
jgi:hypothetical protein